MLLLLRRNKDRMTSALSMWLFPPLFFFNSLFYTDSASVSALMLASMRR
jgi:hypothetical protein